MINLTYKTIFIKLALIGSDPCLKQVFENPTPSRNALRRSIVNSARCLLQFPLIVRDAVWRIQNVTKQCIQVQTFTM